MCGAFERGETARGGITYVAHPHERRCRHRGLRRGGLRLHVVRVERVHRIGGGRCTPERCRTRDESPLLSSRLLAQRLLDEHADVVGERREEREIAQPLGVCSGSHRR